MLVLSRKLNESILIGDEIEIRVTRVEGDTVKLGIEAPRHLAIYRDEVYRQMKDANFGAVRKPGQSMPRLTLFPAPVTDSIQATQTRTSP